MTALICWWRFHLTFMRAGLRTAELGATDSGGEALLRRVSHGLDLVTRVVSGRSSIATRTTRARTRSATCTCPRSWAPWCTSLPRASCSPCSSTRDSTRTSSPTPHGPSPCTSSPSPCSHSSSCSRSRCVQSSGSPDNFESIWRTRTRLSALSYSWFDTGHRV